MSTSQEISDGSPATEISVYPPSQLELIRQCMAKGHTQGDWYLAGELETHPFYPYDFDQAGNDTGNYDFYVAPPEPQLEAAALNRFTGIMLSYFGQFAVKLWHDAEEYPDDSMSLPLAELAKEKVGERIIEKTVTVETFAGPGAAEEPEVEKEDTRKLPITETTRVKVFPDLASAQVVFDYAVMVRDGTLDTRSPDRYGVEWIHKSHHLEDYQLTALKRWYNDNQATRPKIKEILGMPTAT